MAQHFFRLAAYNSGLNPKDGWSKVLRPTWQKKIISETSFPVSLLAKYWKNHIQKLLHKYKKN